VTLDPIPAPIRRFVLKHIHSIAEMEALVMMVKEPSTAWNEQLASARLYIPPAEAGRVLNRLVAHGLAEKRGQAYHQACRSPQDAATVEALVALYAAQLIPITNLIHSRHSSRIQEFAEAFQLRKEDN
jgi:hypothetical protein